MPVIGYMCAGCGFTTPDDGDPNPKEDARKILMAHDDEVHGGSRCTWVGYVSKEHLERLMKECKLHGVKPVVKLIGEDGNAFYILGKVMKALRRAGYSAEDVDRYQEEATSGDYDHLLAVTSKWVNVE